jgi:hypothetical protein
MPEAKAVKTPPTPPEQAMLNASARVAPLGVLFWTTFSTLLYIYGF